MSNDSVVSQTRLSGSTWGDDLDARLETVRTLRDQAAAVERQLIQETGAGAAIPWEAAEAFSMAQSCLENPHRDNWAACLTTIEGLVEEAQRYA